MMMVLEVRSKLLTAVEYSGALVDAAGRERELAAPGFDLVVLSVFVAFPVVFRAEGLGAGGVGTAVGASVAFFVFSGRSLVGDKGFVEGEGYLRSQRRTMVFEH